MQQQLPKVRRVNKRQQTLVFVLAFVAILMVAAVGLLVVSGGVFSDEPQSDAERDYQLLVDGLKENPTNPAVLMSLAEAEYDIGKEEDAFTHAKLAVKYAKEQPAFRIRYANLLLRSDRAKEARVQVLDEIALGTKGDAEPFFLLAQIDREMGDLKSAEKNIKRAIELEPTSVDFLTVYGTILEKRGDTEKAADLYLKAVRFVPDYRPAIEALERLGVEAPAAEETTAHPATDSQ